MNKEKLIKGVKTTLSAVAGIGITMLCSAAAGNVAGASNSGAFRKALMALGGAVIGGMVAGQAEKYLSAGIDDIMTNVEEAVSAVKNATTTTTTNGGTAN